MINKYVYYKVIQQNFNSWEDVDFFEVKSSYTCKNLADRKELNQLIKDYKLMGYPVRVVNRKEENTDYKIFKYLIDCIHIEEKQDATTKEKLQYIKEYFFESTVYPYNVQRYKGQINRLFASFIMDCHSCFNAAYKHSEILRLSKEFGLLNVDCNERQEDEAIQRWFLFLANNWLKLTNSCGIEFSL